VIERRMSRKILQSQDPVEVSDFVHLNQHFWSQYKQVLNILKAEEKQLKSINQTPIEMPLWVKIISFTSPHDLYSMVQVSRFFVKLSDQDKIWKSFLSKFGGEDTAVAIHEKTWKTKFRFFSGKVIKSGFVLKRDDSGFFTSWVPRWLVLSGIELYCFPVADKDDKKCETLEKRLKVGLHKAMTIYNPNDVETVTVLNAKLYQDVALFGVDKWRFEVSDTWFAVPSESARNSWLQTIKRHQNLLNKHYIPILSYTDNTNNNFAMSQ